MSKSRLIFTLLMNDGEYMLSRNFSLQKVGDLKWIKEYYDFDAIAFSIDELIVLNVSREDKDLSKFAIKLLELNRTCFMPVAAGGGIRSLEDARLLLNSGADKLVVNSALREDKELVRSLVKVFGSQCIIASIDYKKNGDKTEVFISNGNKPTGLTIEQAVKNALELGCGEIYLTSMDQDGTGYGYDLEALKKIVNISKVPVIASGGVGKYGQLVEGIQTGADAVSTANLFNFIGDSLTEARKIMQGQGIEMASWKFGLKPEDLK